MRLFHLLSLALVVVAVAPEVAEGRPWQGIAPGTSTLAEVVERFGEPTTRAKRTGRTVVAYYGEQALAGTRQAQFHVDATGVVLEITIFLTAQLDAESVEGTYGKPTQRTFVEDTFQKVWLYPTAGVTVYFSKEGNVEALSFTPGKTARAGAPHGASAAGARPAAATQGGPAPAETSADPAAR
jgi:hypothetical protein